MKRQTYFPVRVGEQPNWLTNYANALSTHAADLSISPTDTGASIDDARYCAFALGPWHTAVRAFSPSTTETVEELLTGTGTAVVTLPVFTAPALPSGVTARVAGALTRIFAMVGRIKKDPAYTEAMGLDLGIVGSVESSIHPVPKFTVEVQRIGAMQVVRLAFFKYTHMGVVIECRRGTGDWEFLGIDTESPYMDERPLLVSTAPEVREYRMSFWDKGTQNGEWTDVAKVTVSP